MHILHNTEPNDFTHQTLLIMNA